MKRSSIIIPSLFIALLGLFLFWVGTCDADPGTWTATGSMNQQRASHASILLPNGKVLVAGGGDGSSGNALSVAEIYDPVTGTWTATGSMNHGRYAPCSAVLLPSGKVLIAGGWAGSVGGFPINAEVYDPAT